MPWKVWGVWGGEKGEGEDDGVERIVVYGCMDRNMPLLHCWPLINN